jgi:DNA end-binding protein Ku
MAISLIDSLATRFEPSKYEDTYTREVHELIDAKAKGHTLSAPEKADDAPKVIDLMAALQASVEAARQRSGSNGAKAGAETNNAATARGRASKTSGTTDARRRRRPSTAETTAADSLHEESGLATKATATKATATKATADEGRCDEGDPGRRRASRQRRSRRRSHGPAPPDRAGRPARLLAQPQAAELVEQAQRVVGRSSARRSGRPRGTCSSCRRTRR